MNARALLGYAKAPVVAAAGIVRGTPSGVVGRFSPVVDREIMIEIGERKVMEIKKHWMASTRQIIKLAIATGIWFFLLAWSPQVNADLWWVFGYYQWFGWYAVFGLMVFLTARAGWKITDHFRDRFVISNQRIFRVNGVIGKQDASIPLAKVTDITVVQSWLGRLCNYGHWIFESPGQVQGFDEIRHVQDPQTKKRVLMIALRGDNPDALVLDPAQNNPNDDGT